jgi:thiaminase/transcriptional activator TenA
MCIVCERLAARSGNPLFRRYVVTPNSPFERLKQVCSAEWRAYCEHEFVKQLGAGTLPMEAFQHYLKQDYLFLVHFGRAWGLAVYKSRDIGQLRQSLDSLKAIIDVELDLHIKYCAEWGISEAELLELTESRATLAYTRYVLEAGNRGDILDLHVALAPCIVGYAEIGNWLVEQRFTVRMGNPYGPWIDMYTSKEFQNAARAEVDWINAQMQDISEARFRELSRIFSEATRLEADFWQMGLTQS